MLHLARIYKSDVAVCTGKTDSIVYNIFINFNLNLIILALTAGKIDDDHAASYCLLYNTTTKKRDNAMAIQKTMEASISTHNTTTPLVLDAKRRKIAPRAVEDSITSTLSTVTGNNTLVSLKGSCTGGQPSGSVKKNLQLKVHDGSNA
jgi:hypothetical protein